VSTGFGISEMRSAAMPRDASSRVSAGLIAVKWSTQRRNAASRIRPTSEPLLLREMDLVVDRRHDTAAAEETTHECDEERRVHVLDVQEVETPQPRREEPQGVDAERRRARLPPQGETCPLDPESVPRFPPGSQRLPPGEHDDFRSAARDLGCEPLRRRLRAADDRSETGDDVADPYRHARLRPPEAAPSSASSLTGVGPERAARTRSDTRRPTAMHSARMIQKVFIFWLGTYIP
jgi:hypothetical protein